MLQVIIAGNLGKDAVHKSTQQGKDFCSFPIAASIGWGDKKQTIWIDVTKWGEGSKGLANLLRKGSKVTVIGELSTREHEGKTYLQCRASDVALQGDAPGGDQFGKQHTDGSRSGGQPQGGFADDLSDDIPF
jgi:single-strand DNA-binding protein